MTSSMSLKPRFPVRTCAFRTVLGTGRCFFFSRFVEVAGTWWDALWEHEIPKTQCVFFLSTSQSLHFAGHGEGEQADIVCEDGSFAAGREFANIFFSARDQKLLL